MIEAWARRFVAMVPPPVIVVLVTLVHEKAIGCTSPELDPSGLKLRESKATMR